MTRVSFLVGLVALIGTFSLTAAHGAVEIRPDRYAPIVKIKATKHEGSLPSYGAASGIATDSGTEEEYNPPCRIDPVLRMDKPRYICDFPPESEEAQPARAQLTHGMVLEAVQEIGLPSLDVRIQPGSSTLVNIDTIFYTDPEPFRRSTSILGFTIDLQADAISYTWHHGDGTSASTGKPGRPYPAMDVTHRYRQPEDSVHPRVDVTYRVRFRVDGGSWQAVGQTLSATGPTTTLEVREAAPVLTKR